VTLSTPHKPTVDRFNEVFGELLPRLYRRAVMLTGGEQAAQDVVHEAYLKIVRRHERFLGHPEPYAYAFAAMVSVVRDQWRRERRTVLVDTVPDSAYGGGDAESYGCGYGTSPHDTHGKLEIIRLLRQLTARQAAVVILVDLDGYTIDQSAAILGVHRGTADRTRRRALEKLRELLTAEAGTDRDKEAD
jgi:RNA polymerase sigma-70 factor (ECF subfamily)